MSRLTARCQVCGTELTQSHTRTIDVVGRRVLVCKLCFLKLPEKDRSNRDGKRELRDQALHEQLPLPF